MANEAELTLGGNTRRRRGSSVWGSNVHEAETLLPHPDNLFFSSIRGEIISILFQDCISKIPPTLFVIKHDAVHPNCLRIVGTYRKYETYHVTSSHPL
jgi:hypothetical protein